MSWFELGGVQVPMEALAGFSQDYEPIEAATLHRMADGTGKKQTAWVKIRTVLSAGGYVPAGLDGLDYSANLLLKCAMPKVIASTSSVIALPSARRRDSGFEPRGYAIVNRRRVDTTIGLTGDLAALGAVSGASHYHAFYYPEITVSASPPEIGGGIHEMNLTWRIVAEEI